MKCTERNELRGLLIDIYTCYLFRYERKREREAKQEPFSLPLRFDANVKHVDLNVLLMRIDVTNRNLF